MTDTAAGEGAWADDRTATFGVADPEHALAGVRLQQDLRLAPGLADFRPTPGGWELVLDRPPVDRIEYLLELRSADGGSKIVTDPGNPRLVGGAFGPKSVLEFPGYAQPSWLTAPADPGRTSSFDVPGPDGVIPVRTWTPLSAGAGEPLPLLVVHDGPEFDSLASLTQYLGAGVAAGWLPRLRAALLGPGPRSDWYSADPRYARALCRSVLPALASRMTASARIGMGASLGALAMLHAHCRYRGSFDALFLQSGSFFTPVLDRQEGPFPHFRRITAFVGRVHDGSMPGSPVPAVLTCGEIEWNAANNRSMAEDLSRLGYPAVLHEVPDAHNYTAWRDAFDPHLSQLLRLVAE